MENSSELLDRGFGQVLADLAALGYDAEWHCIPASYVGSPHIRDRIWIIAHRSTGGRDMADAVQTDALWEADAGLAAKSDKSRAWIRKERFAKTWWNWPIEPGMGRVVDGLPGELDRRNGALGNAVVPQIPELIGNAILDAIGWRDAA